LSPDRRLTLYDSIRSDKQDAFFPKICNQPEATEKYRKDQVLFLKVLSGLYKSAPDNLRSSWLLHLLARYCSHKEPPAKF